MVPDDQNASKLLFVMSAAFGELFNAMYMVMGSGFRTVFALRDAQFLVNHTALPGKSLRYGNRADLLAIIESEKPDMVCLFSGYLLIDEKVMDVAELNSFIDHLLGRGIKVITSDPFLGLPSRVPMFDPNNPFEQLLSVPVKLVGGLLFGQSFLYFSGMPSLKRIPHVYVVEPDEPGETQRLGFFNPHIRRYASELADSASLLKHQNGTTRSKQYWMFIFGKGEYLPLVNRDGVQHVHALLAEKLRETLEAGRLPVLFAPKDCIDALAADAILNHCVLLHTCDYNRYMSLLVGAEYVFYWNIFSASILARLVNHRPTFFFGTGHIAEFDQMMFDKGMRQYYKNARLTYLDQTHLLSQTELAGLALLQEEQMLKPVCDNLCHLPLPSEMIQRLLNQ
jgi:hypothetical protein